MFSPTCYINSPFHYYTYTHIHIYIQGVLLQDRQTLRGYSRYEDKHYSTGNHGVQTSSIGAWGH